MAWSAHDALVIRRPIWRRRRPAARGRVNARFVPPPLTYEVVRHGNVTTVTVLGATGGAKFYHWYVDGAFVARSVAARRSFVLELDDRASIQVVATSDPDHDPIANAPVGYPARRTLRWVRSADRSIKSYKIRQQRGAEAVVLIGTTPHESGRWSYSFLTPRLDDLTSYTWYVTPLDEFGNAGTVIEITELIVRRPDPPDFTVAFDGGTTKVTFAAA